MKSDLPECVGCAIDEAAINEYLIRNGFYDQMNDLQAENRNLRKELESLRKSFSNMSRTLENSRNDATLARRRSAELEDRFKRELCRRNEEARAFTARLDQLTLENSKLESDRDRLRERICAAETPRARRASPRIYTEPTKPIEVTTRRPSDDDDKCVEQSLTCVVSPRSIMQGLSISAVDTHLGPYFHKLGG